MVAWVYQMGTPDNNITTTMKDEDMKREKREERGEEREGIDKGRAGTMTRMPEVVPTRAA